MQRPLHVCLQGVPQCVENSFSDRYWTSRSYFFPLSVIIPWTSNTRKFILFFFLEVNIQKSILLFSTLHRRYALSQFPLKKLMPTAWLLKQILFCPGHKYFLCIVDYMEETSWALFILNTFERNRCSLITTNQSSKLGYK